MIGWAEKLGGPHVLAGVRKILEAKPHPEMGYRLCLVLIHDGKRYDVGRINAAYRRAPEIARTRGSAISRVGRLPHWAQP